MAVARRANGKGNSGMPEPRLVIEYPAAGHTYCRNEYGVYRYSEHPRNSVNEGREQRSFVDSFADLDEARKAFPDAEWHGDGTGFRDQPLPAEPPEWFDPDLAGETWADPDDLDLERRGLL